MKYYAVTDDPRELYHYGVKGMKWGQHIFGDKPKSPGYHRALKKLKASMTKSSKSVASGIQKVGKAAQKSAAQIAQNRRQKQEDKYNKAVEKQQRISAQIDVMAENYRINKAIKSAKRQARSEATKEAVGNAAYAVQRSAAQIAQNKRQMEQNRFNKAVQKAQVRNDLAIAFKQLDQEDKFRKQNDRERKMDQLREKQADIMANNDLKSLSRAVKVEKHMPAYYQQAREGTLAYGKLSDEQVARLQNRLALEAQTRRLGTTEAPSWRVQKKMARKEGYLQGITKGTAAAMEEVARAGVQYGIRNLANRRKLDKKSELEAERQKTANRIKNKKSHSEMREDLKQEAYEAQLKAGVHGIQRGAVTTRGAAKQLQYAKRIQNENQNKLNDINDERKFLMEERHNASRDERQAQQRLNAHNNDVDSIGKSLIETGYALIPSYDKQGKKNGTKLLVRDSEDKEAKAYVELYKGKHGITDEKESENKISVVNTAERNAQIRQMAEDKRQAELNKQREEHAAKVDKANEAHIKSEQRRQELKEMADRAVAREEAEAQKTAAIKEKQFQQFVDMQESKKRSMNDAIRENRNQRNKLENIKIDAQKGTSRVRPTVYLRDEEDIFGTKHKRRYRR